jgi:mannose-6-phosphate isomerase-like protein (cupin superfamily)
MTLDGVVQAPMATLMIGDEMSSGTMHIPKVVLTLGIAVLVGACSSGGPGRSPEAPNVRSVAESGAILAAGEGERRVRRPPPGQLSTLSAPFILKVDRRNAGASDFVMLYEDIPTGQAISPHHHPNAEEILFVHRGSGVVSLGSRTSVVTQGATIFIPRNVRASLRNTGAEPLGIVAVFSRPGFEEYQRAISVPEGERAEPLSVAELQAIRERHKQHVGYDRP